MDQTEESRPISRRTLERILRLRLLDDIFMKAVLKDNPEAVQDIIRVILHRGDIEVVEVRIQDEWPNLVGHSVRLDVTARDLDGNWYNIEIQRDAGGANEKRARYNLGALDWNTFPVGADYETLPEAYIIFVTETDIFGRGLPLYTVNRFVEETGEPFRDHAHILYANASYQGTDDFGKLMADFRETDPRKMHYESIANRAAYFKTTEGGKITMSSVVEEILQEGVRKGVRKGRRKEREIGLRVLVETLQALERSQEEAVSIVERRYKLSHDKAEETVRQYWA